MKRESVDTPSILSPALTSPASPPPSDSPSPPGPKTKKRKSTSATKPAQANAASGEFTPDKKAHLMDLIITAGYKSLDMGEVAKELGLNAKQLQNAFAPNRKGNLRDKAVTAVAGK